jgi:hypothetical protein
MMTAAMTLASMSVRAGTGGVPAPARGLPQAAELGLTAGVLAGPDGSLEVVATAGDLSVRKAVYADGRFTLRIARGADDSIEIVGEPAGLRVRAGRDAAVWLRTDAGPGHEDRARHVRTSLARSEAVHRLRQIATALDLDDAATPEALSLRITGALLAELSGDTAAAQRFSRTVTAQLSRRLRKAQTSSTSCWDTYQALVNQAANELASCLASFAIYNPARNLCSFVWVLQVESAWFSFLACSSFPVK